MTTTATENLHQPVIDGSAVRCGKDDCYHAIFGLIHPTIKDDPEEQERGKRMFRTMHTAENEPGRAPSIEVEYRIVASCSVCPDGGDVDMSDSETLECSQCHTTWDEKGQHGERAEPEDDEEDEPEVEAHATTSHACTDRYCAARDSQGGIRLNGGYSLLVAEYGHTRADVADWFRMSKPGDYREQYRAALRLLDREQNLTDERPVHPDETTTTQGAHTP